MWKDRSLREEGDKRSTVRVCCSTPRLRGVPQGRLLPLPRPSKARSGHASGDGQTNSSPPRKYPGFKFSLSCRRVQLSQGWTKNTKSMQENQTIETLGKCFFLKDLSLLGKPAAMLWTALWRRPCAEELNFLPAAREQEGLPTTTWLGVEEDYPGPVEPWDDCSLAKQFECKLVRDLEPEPPS